MIHIASDNTTSKLTNIMNEDVQPNAVDLRVAKIMKINTKPFLIDEERKVHRGSNELFVEEDGYWRLEPGSYEIIMENTIEVGMGESGFVITRSTLNRNGIFITSGLYDSGYHGMMAAALHVGVDVAYIKPGTRVGQYLCFASETLSAYDGDYGFGKEHDRKYN